MIINIDIRGGSKTWDIEKIQDLASFALNYAHAPQNSELSVSLVDIDEIHSLNKEYRGIDRPTDVLSFECDSIDEELPEDETLTLGDIIIACDIVDSQREQFGTSFDEEMSLMLVHGCLHVLGYDHIEEDEAEIMEGLEKEILEAYGICGVR